MKSLPTRPHPFAIAAQAAFIGCVFLIGCWIVASVVADVTGGMLAPLAQIMGAGR